MTWELRCKMEIKTGFTNEVLLTTPEGERIETDIGDILDAAFYMLTNTDLEKNDPRIGFIEVVKNMEEVPGFNTLHALGDRTARYPSTRLQYGKYNSLFHPNWTKENEQ